MADQPDMTRHHQNNLDHMRAVYLSALFITPKSMWVDELDKVKNAVFDKLEEKK